ncbi:unnamed protein product, partial [Mesorhabditis spiculigera]
MGDDGKQKKAKRTWMARTMEMYRKGWSKQLIVRSMWQQPLDRIEKAINDAPHGSHTFRADCAECIEAEEERAAAAHVRQAQTREWREANRAAWRRQQEEVAAANTNLVGVRGRVTLLEPRRRSLTVVIPGRDGFDKRVLVPAWLLNTVDGVCRDDFVVVDATLAMGLNDCLGPVQYRATAVSKGRGDTKEPALPATLAIAATPTAVLVPVVHASPLLSTA